MIRKTNYLVALVSIFIISFLFLGCEKEMMNESSLSTYSYLDFPEDMVAGSEEYQAIIKEAAERMDRYVKYENQQFILISCTPDDLSLSPTVFEHMTDRMEKQNDALKEMDIDSYIVHDKTLSLSNKEMTPIRLKSGTTEGTVPGGINGVGIEHKWYGTIYRVSLSDNTLRYTSYASIAAGSVAAGTGAAAPLGMVFGLNSLSCQVLRDEYPNGVTISYMKPNGSNVPIPYSITGK